MHLLAKKSEGYESGCAAENNTIRGVYSDWREPVIDSRRKITEYGPRGNEGEGGTEEKRIAGLISNRYKNKLAVNKTNDKS